MRRGVWVVAWAGLMLRLGLLAQPYLGAAPTLGITCLYEVRWKHRDFVGTTR